MRFLWVGFLFAGCVVAQPRIYYRGIVNSASSMAPALPAGSIARGSTFSLYGANIGPATSPTLSYPLQTTLGGVSIAVTQGATTVNAIPVYVSAGQLSAIMPSNAPLGVVNLRVTYNNSRTNFAPVTVVNSSFGIFTAAGSGTGPGIFQNFVSATSEPTNALSTAVQPGQVVTLWGTGLGPSLDGSDTTSPVTGNLSTKTEVWVGGVLVANLIYYGRAPGIAGVDVVIFNVPTNAPTGCWVPVFVRTAGTTVSNSATMAIAANGSTCSEPNNALATSLIAGSRTERVVAARIALHHDVGTATTNDSTTDTLGVYAGQETAGPFNFDPTVSLPPAGTCTAYTMAGDFTQNSGFPPGLLSPTPTGRALSAGTVTVGSASSTGLTAGAYLTPVGGSISTVANTTNTLTFNPGTLNVSAASGTDVGAFQATLTVPSALTWTNRDQLQTITRSSGFTANWSGAASGNTVFVAGAAADLPNNASSVFICIAKPGDTSLTVPPYILSNMPGVRNRLIQSRGVVYVGQWPLASPTTFTAQGVDSGLLVPIETSGRTVMFQ
jgi:uncharacterized protein (TIGR03437 family)